MVIVEAMCKDVFLYLSSFKYMCVTQKIVKIHNNQIKPTKESFNLNVLSYEQIALTLKCTLSQKPKLYISVGFIIGLVKYMGRKTQIFFQFFAGEDVPVSGAAVTAGVP